MPPTEPYTNPLFALCYRACEATLDPEGDKEYYIGWALGFEWCCRLFDESPALMRELASAVIRSSDADAPGPPPATIIESLLQMLPDTRRRVEAARGFRLPEAR